MGTLAGSSGCEREVAHFAAHFNSGSSSNVCFTSLHRCHKVDINHSNLCDDDKKTRSSDDGAWVEIIGFRFLVFLLAFNSTVL